MDRAKKAIIIGIDGTIEKRLKKYSNDGKLPNIKALILSGLGLSPLVGSLLGGLWFGMAPIRVDTPSVTLLGGGQTNDQGRLPPARLNGQRAWRFHLGGWPGRPDR